MNLFTRRRSLTIRVGTMLSVGMWNGAATTGRTKPKTRTNETRRMTGTSSTAFSRALLRPARSLPSTLEEAAYPVQRPEAQEGLALYVLLGQRPEDARVRRVGPVVAHHEDVVLRDRGRGEEAPVGELLVRVGLPLGLPVHDEAPRADRYPVAGEADDALYEVRLRVVHALEDDDVAALGFGEAVDELVHEDAVVDLERRDHAARGDPERLHHEGPDEAEDQREGDDEDDEVLEDAPALLLAGRALLFRGAETLVFVGGQVGHEDKG